MIFRIKEIRLNLELTQGQIATMLYVTRSAYSLWEIEKNIIPLIKLNDFCNTFNISMDYITRLSDKRINIQNKNKLNKKDIGRNIKIIRKKNKLTQEKLAYKFNTTHSAISAYENGITMIPTLFLLEFCKITNSSMDDICDKVKKKEFIYI